MDLERLASTARSYPHLQGLLAVPVGLLFILAALFNAGWEPLAQPWVFVACALALVLAHLRIARFYRETYGRVRQTRHEQRKVAVVVVASAAGFLAINLLLGSRDHPVSVLAASFGAMMLAYFATFVRLSLHHVLIFGAIVIGGLLPIWGGLGEDRDLASLTVMGIATILSGLFDHLQLTRTLSHARLPDLEAANHGA